VTANSYRFTGFSPLYVGFAAGVPPAFCCPGDAMIHSLTDVEALLL